VVVDHGQVDVGVAAAELRDGTRDERGVGGRDAGQPQPATAQPGDLPELLLGLVQAGEHRLGMHHEGAAGVGEAYRSHATVDEGGARLALERGDLLADRGLGERERVGRGRERATGGDLPQHEEPPGIEHKRSLSKFGIRKPDLICVGGEPRGHRTHERSPVRLSLTQPQRPSRRSMGDAAIGTRTLLIGELLCESVDLHAGERVLDVPCGSGSAALAAARRFCRVVGVDVPERLEPARRRAQAEGLEVAFLEGKVEDLPLPDSSFEVVLSAGDAISIPGQEGMVGELLRVCRPGGRIGMVAWTPDGYVGELFAAIGRHLPWGHQGAAARAARAGGGHHRPAAQLPVAFLIGRAPGGVPGQLPRPDGRGAAGAGARPCRRPQG